MIIDFFFFYPGGAGNINATAARSTADEQHFSQQDIVVTRSNYQNE